MRNARIRATVLLAALAAAFLAAPLSGRAQQGRKYRIPLKKARIPVGILQGRVTDPAGQAIGATLELAPRSRPEKSIGVPLDPQSGAFEIKLKPDVYRITASAPRHITSVVEVDVRDKYRARLPLELLPAPVQAPGKKPPPPKGKKLTIKYSRDTEIGDELDEGKLDVIALEEMIHYDPDEILVPRSARALLEKLALLLSRDPGIVRIEIVGHSQPVGEAGLERRNSLRRATYVKNTLVEQGIDPARIRIEGRGAAEPRAEGHSAESARENNRVEFTLYKLKP